MVKEVVTRGRAFGRSGNRGAGGGGGRAPCLRLQARGRQPHLTPFRFRRRTLPFLAPSASSLPDRRLWAWTGSGGFDWPPSVNKWTRTLVGSSGACRAH